MSSRIARAKASVIVGLRQAIAVGVTIIAIAFVRGIVDLVFDHRFRVDWRLTLTLAAVFSLGWFLLLFVYSFSRIVRNENVEEVLNPAAVGTAEPLPFFVAMEYYAFIANRSFLVFAAPDGLYGWKFEGMVDTSNPLYFQPYSDMAKKWSPTPDGLRKIAEQRGNFFIPRSEVASVEFVNKSKWGMGSISHSGRLYLHLTNGNSREFVLLGTVDGDQIKRIILDATNAVAIPV